MATDAFVLAFALIRIPRGGARPSDAAFRAALAQDRQQLRLPPLNGHVDYATSGPHEIVVDGNELDEYTVWEK